MYRGCSSLESAAVWYQKDTGIKACHQRGLHFLLQDENLAGTTSCCPYGLLRAWQPVGKNQGKAVLDHNEDIKVECTMMPPS